MSLSARIPLVPSRRLALAERTMPVIWLGLAVATLVARWPSATIGLLALAALLAGLFASLETRRARRIRPITLGVTAHAEVDLRFGVDGATEATWRLVESTVAWPGFVMLALSLAARPETILRRPVLTAELPAPERYALARFVLWTLRRRGRGDAREESRAD